MWGCIRDLCYHNFSNDVDVVTELEENCLLSELLYAEDLVLMSQTIECLWNKFRKLNFF